MPVTSDDATPEGVTRSPSRLRRLARAVAYGIVVALVVSALAFLVRVRFGPIISADDSAIRSATAVTRDHDGLRRLLVAWQWAFQPVRVYLVATVICLWVWFARHLRTRAWWAFLTMMVGWNLALDVKLLVARARPLVAKPIEHAPGYSFPSGHVANIAIGSSAVVVLLWPLLGRGARWAAVVLGSALVIATALDRVFLGVHFPSDCVGGILLGCGLVLASYAGYVGWNPADPKASTDPPTEES